MKISPFTPLNFGGRNGSDGIESRYVQTWAVTDEIMVQVFGASGESAPSGALMNAATGAVVGAIDWQSWQMNSGKTVYFHTWRGLSPGCYRVAVGDVQSDLFIVTDDAARLAHTSLIQYRFKDNKQRDDVVSVIDRIPYFFDWRVPGGFKASGWRFGVGNEQFTTQREDVVELYAYDYTVNTFTMGGHLGVPVWYGEMLNRLLTCSFVYIDGVRYMRSETEVPEMNTIVDGLDSFVFSQPLRRSNTADEVTERLNQLCIRRVDADYNRVDYEPVNNVMILK